jgi:hypothetical protein
MWWCAPVPLATLDMSGFGRACECFHASVQGSEQPLKVPLISVGVNDTDSACKRCGGLGHQRVGASNDILSARCVVVALASLVVRGKEASEAVGIAPDAGSDEAVL